VWTLTSGILAMSCHVVADAENFNRTQLLSRVIDLAREQFHIDHTTIQIEEPNIPQDLVASCHCHFGAWDTQ
jgi:cobalt-zinc-cadmium efflux system protein